MRRISLVTLALLGVLAIAGCSSDDASVPRDGAGGATSIDGAGGAGGAATTSPFAGEVRRYDYSFDLVTARATSRLSVNVLPPGGDCFDVACRTTAAEAPRWSGAPAASAALSDGALRLCGTRAEAGDTVELGASAVIAEATSFELDVGFSRKRDMAGGEFTYLLSWVGGCDRFGPCDNDPARFAEFHFEVTHPEGSVVLCPGVLTPGSSVTRCDLAGTLAPTYSAFALAADPLWQRRPFTSAAGVDVVFYEVPGGELAAWLDAASVGEFLSWLTELLGPFPYGEELRVAGAPTAWLGFEHPANIVLQERLPRLGTDYSDTTMHVLMHEIAHQWAGDRTTLASAADFVWKEGTAEYLAYVFEDEHRPPGEAAATRNLWDSASLTARYYPRPLEEPTPPVHMFYGDAYGPGPMVLYLQLESMLGREVVLNGLRRFLSGQAARSVEDLRAALEEASGRELRAYFDAWVFGEGAPDWPGFTVEAAQQGGQATVTVTQQSERGTLFGCEVEVEIAGATISARVVVEFGLAPSSASASAQVPFTEPITSVVLDPDHRVIGHDLSGTSAAAPTRRVPVWTF